jgi:iron complex outermembrane receptor protein
MKTKRNYAKGAFILILLQLVFVVTWAQKKAISGTVQDINGKAIPGASIKVKGLAKSASTNDKGYFVIGDTGEGKVTLQISFIGYITKEVLAKAGDQLTVVLTEEANNMEDIVVTGTFDRRKRLDASVAISSLSASQIERLTPISSADLLKNVPGVFVNSSLGEIRNSVASRGITVGTQDGSFGYEYVSMQEDGLPITNTTYFNYGPDFFLRPDATLARLDAVRGGTASITAANAPGGLFNYISKTGGDTFEGEVRLKYGVLGSDGNNYTRVDLNVGGPLGDNFYYNVGGFYRYDQGARYPGFAMNNGGQIKANLVKKYKNGSLKLFGKYLNDRNGYPQFGPTQDFNNPTPSVGFDINSATMLPSFQYSFNNFLEAGKTINFDSRDQVNSKYKSIGLNWDHNFGNGWTITNAARYSDNSTLYNNTGRISISSIVDANAYSYLGILGAGTYSFKNQSGTELARVNAVTTGATTAYTAALNNLPGQGVVPNSLLLNTVNYYSNGVEEFVDQLTINKKIKNMTFTTGGYFGYSDVHRVSSIAGAALTTMENRPQLLSLEFTGTSTAGTTGTHKVMDASGIAIPSGTTAALISFNGKQRQAALFFGHTWEIDSRFTLDWGFRYENSNVKGFNIRSFPVTSTTGGNDNNRLTLYDNYVAGVNQQFDYNKKLETFSYSGALNYKFNNNFAVYARYSRGKKTPDMDVYFAATTAQSLQFLNPLARTTDQLELGFKVKTDRLNLFITPFYSVLSGVPTQQIFQDNTGVFYTPPTTYGKYRTPGVEIEADYKIAPYLSLRGVATFQKSKIVSYTIWSANTTSRDDDTLTGYDGNETDNNARAMINLTPTYTHGKFYAFVTWAYMGKRQANAANVFQLPAFSQFDGGAGYRFNDKLDLTFNVNNIFNTYGAMSWQRPGTLTQILQGNAAFSSAFYNTAVSNNTPYWTVSIPPTSFFIALKYKF